MNKKYKAIISTALALVLSMSALPIQNISAWDYSDDVIYDEDDVARGAPVLMPVTSGATSSDNSNISMESALTTVKERIKVPSELTEFTYNTNISHNTTQYNFSWTTPSEAEIYSSLSVSIIGDIITRFDTYTYSYSTYNVPKLAKLTDSALLSKAKAALKAINPTISSKCKITANGVSLLGNTANFSIIRYYDDLWVSGNSGSVNLDKNTGELSSFYINWWDNAVFPDKSTAISDKKVQAAYQELNTLTPYYRIKEDSKTGKRTAKIVYSPSFYDNIDALTGKKSTMSEDKLNDTAAANSLSDAYGDTDVIVDDEAIETSFDTGSGGSSVKVIFTEAEKKAVTENQKLLTQDKVLEILKKDKYLNLTDKNTTCTASLSYQESNSAAEKSTYNWDFYFKYEDTNTVKNISVTVNAETGKIENFNKSSSANYKYYYDDSIIIDALPVLDVKKSQTIAANAMKYYSPEIYKKYKADISNEREVTYWGVDNKYYTTSRVFYFNRYCNNIEVTGDYINIQVDSTGEVTSFYYNHTDNVIFAKAENLLTEKELYKKLFAQEDFELHYSGFITMAGKVKTYLNYNIGSYTLNAKSGNLCDYYGNEIAAYNNNNNAVVYNDIKGIKAEKAINDFKRHGVMLESVNDKFEPDKAITEHEFSLLLKSVFNNYEVYNAFVKANSKDGKLVSDKKLTKAAACKYFIKAINSDESAKLKGIYTSPYSDVSPSRSDIGYIALAYAKGAITVDSTGKFNPDKAMTRAEAILMLYNYVSKL